MPVDQSVSAAWLTERLRDIRQLAYAPAFRIDAIQAPENETLANMLADVQARLDQQPAEPQQFAAPGDNFLHDDKFVSGLLTRLWRVQDKLSDTKTGTPLAGNEQSYRHVERIINEFAERGLRIEDQQGRGYDAGMAVDVIASEPVPGIDRAVINETIQPAIYKGTELIQRAQVVVGIAADAQSKPSAER